jgi:hypothetical protein
VKIEDRLRRELNDTAEHLALDKDTYEHVLDLGRRRRRSRQLSAAVGAAMIVTVVVGVLALRPPGTPGPIVATTATTSPPGTTTTLAPAGNFIPATTGVLLATPNDGIVISGFDGSSSSLTSDTYYEGIAWVISDGAGGIIFQHEVTPLPWTQGAILQLPALATSPSVLVSPDPGTYVRPLDTDSGLLLYRVDSGGTSEVRTIDLRTQAIQTVIPATEFLINAGAEDGAVVAAYGGDCPRLEVFGLDGSDRQINLDAGECQVGFINDLAFSGGYVYTIEDTESRNLVRRDLETGETVVAPIGDAWSVAALPDGTVAAGGSDIVIGTFQADVFNETTRVPASTSFALAAIDGFPDATLGTGTGELPCTPLDLPPLSPQGLPQAVEDKRLLIFEMASSCDLHGLAEIALADGITFSYGAETDPLRSWIRSARNGFDVMSWIVRIFNSSPAIDESGTYAWPAVHVTGSDLDWDALSGILTSAEFEQYSQFRESGWLGLRIGIAQDGTWRFVVAGD